LIFLARGGGRVPRRGVGSRPATDPVCLYLFDDANEFKLGPGVAENVGRSGLASDLLLGASTGMAIYDPVHRPILADEISPSECGVACPSGGRGLEVPPPPRRKVQAQPRQGQSLAAMMLRALRRPSASSIVADYRATFSANQR
jgi:hypothetical protein